MEALFRRGSRVWKPKTLARELVAVLVSIQAHDAELWVGFFDTPNFGYRLKRFPELGGNFLSLRMAQSHHTQIITARNAAKFLGTLLSIRYCPWTTTILVPHPEEVAGVGYQEFDWFVTANTLRARVEPMTRAQFRALPLRERTRMLTVARNWANKRELCRGLVTDAPLTAVDRAMTKLRNFTRRMERHR